MMRAQLGLSCRILTADRLSAVIADGHRAHEVSRRLRSRCEAVYGVMFSAPEYQGAYGLDTAQWYMAGRVAPLGPVSAEVACAVLGSFNPRLVHAGIDGVWSMVAPDRMVSLKLDSVGPGLDPVEVNVLNELWRQVPIGTVSLRLMGWDQPDVAAAMGRLEVGGLAAHGAITPAGTELREEIELRTSAQQASIVEALGDDADRLLALLDPWARAVADAR